MVPGIPLNLCVWKLSPIINCDWKWGGHYASFFTMLLPLHNITNKEQYLNTVNTSGKHAQPALLSYRNWHLALSATAKNWNTNGKSMMRVLIRLSQAQKYLQSDPKSFQKVFLCWITNWCLQPSITRPWAWFFHCWCHLSWDVPFH